jgi:endoglycosylceramidase
MTQSLLRTLLLTLLLPLFANNVVLAQDIKHGLRDDAGRHMIPRGFVVNTNDAGGEVNFTQEDYVRMVRLGANVQVVRLELGKLSTFGHSEFQPEYLARLKRAVRLGREAGINTMFKLTVYGAKGFSWPDLYFNQNNAQGKYIGAWRHIWDAFKDNDAVIGYDLVNEPRKKELTQSYDELTSDYLIPLYEKIIDAALPYNDEKLFLIQTIFMNKGEAINKNQYAEIKERVNRKNIVFAPHIYQEYIDYIAPTMERFDKEADLLQAPILVGEWGFPTLLTTDQSVEEQLHYIEFYIRTAEIFDKMGIGSIKAWFLGNRSYQNFLPGGESTWAIFSDKQADGTVERKYITDIIARPYPQYIAGDIKNFMFHFATRTLNLNIKTDNSKGASRIFVGADRHYPDGFSIHIGDDLILTHSPIKTGFRVHSSKANTKPSDFIWDADRQQLVVLAWPKDEAIINVRIEPGIYREPDPAAKN